MNIEADPVPLRVDEQGDVRVGNTRGLLELVVQAYEEGGEPETIIRMYPSLELADVHACIGYFLRHREAVKDYMARQERDAQQVREEIEAQAALREARERACQSRARRTQPGAPARQ